MKNKFSEIASNNKAILFDYRNLKYDYLQILEACIFNQLIYFYLSR